MLSIPPVPYRKRRGRGRLQKRQPVAPLVLVGAQLIIDDNHLNLTFDRPIDITGIDVTTITVLNGPAGIIFGCNPDPELISPTTVQFELLYLNIGSGPSITLSVTSANGIAAADDEGTWTGVEGVVLPFPG